MCSWTRVAGPLALLAGCWLLAAMAPAGAAQKQKSADEIAQRLADAYGGRITRDESREGHPIVGVDLSNTRINDAGLRGLSRLKDVEVLSLEGVDVGDVGTQEIASLVKLRSLILKRTPVTDRGLAALAKLNKLETLSLGFTSTGDAGLAHVTELGELRTLDLSLTRVTDRGVEGLARCRKLSRLTLRFTRVSKEAIARLQKALPELEVEK